MFRKFAITSLVAFSLIASPFAASTAVARDNTDRFLMGLVTLGILGAIVHDKNKDKAQPQYHHRQNTHIKRPHTQPTRWAETHRHRNGVVHRHVHGKNHHHGAHRPHYGHGKHNGHVRGHKRVQAKPKACLRQKWTRNGWVKYYDRRCLAKRGW